MCPDRIPPVSPFCTLNIHSRNQSFCDVFCSTLDTTGSVTLLTLPAEYAEQGPTNGRASVRPSVRLSHRLIAATAAGGF